MSVPHAGINCVGMEATLLVLAVTAAEVAASRPTLAAPVSRPLLRHDRFDPARFALRTLPPSLRMLREAGSSADPLIVLAPRRPAPCPHCLSRRVQRWGRFGTRQRYRCRDCGRTHSELTGTSLYRLHRPELWPAFCRCMLESRTVRKAAAELGVSPSTAFRWRHRLLDEVRLSERYPLGAAVSVGEGQLYGRLWLLIALDERGRCGSVTLGARRAGLAEVAGLLNARLQRRCRLLSREGPLGATARFARSRSLPWQQQTPGNESLQIERPLHYVFRVRRWLHRFHGIGDHYADNYMSWFRLLDGQLWNGLRSAHSEEASMEDRGGRGRLAGRRGWRVMASGSRRR